MSKSNDKFDNNQYGATREDMQTAAADAILKKLGPISDEEFNFYMGK